MPEFIDHIAIGAVLGAYAMLRALGYWERIRRHESCLGVDRALSQVSSASERTSR